MMRCPTVSPEMAGVLRGLSAPDSAFADYDRELLTLIDTTTDPAAIVDLLGPLTAVDGHRHACDEGQCRAAVPSALQGISGAEARRR